ncbi:hypothetical protein ACOSQ3_013119 [Xanthoceras sorbifolium]
MSFSVGQYYCCNSSAATPTLHHSKFRNPITAYRRRRYRPPGTPLSHWKYVDEGQRGGGGVALSARKLAAGLWQLRLLAEISSGGGAGGGRVKFGSCDWLRFQPPTDAEHVNIALLLHRSSRKYDVEPRGPWQSPLLNCSSNHKIPHKHESSLLYRKSAMEGATKWDPRCSKTSTEAYYYTHMKLLEDQVAKLSVGSALQAELVQARLQILQLEDEQRSSKKKFKHLMRKLGEERKSRRSKEHHKIRAVIDDFKDELSKERKSRKKIEILNSKLVKELADGESAAKQLMEDYREEKRGREIMQEICNELAKKIGEDKAELEALNCEAMKIRAEVEEERRMLQLAEIWREERVQMKLIDAKLALEYKYHQMNKLVADLESLVSSQSAPQDIAELRKAELIRQAVKSVNIQDIKEFEYVPPKSSDIFSIFEELQRGKANERESEPLVNYSPVGGASNSQIVHHEVNKYNNNYELNYSNSFIVCNSGLEPDSRIWEAVDHVEDQGSRCSLKGSDHSRAIVTRGKFSSRSIIACNENGGQNSPNTEINEVCSTSGGQLKQKASSVYKLRSSFPSNREITSDGGDRMLSSGAISSVGTTSLRRKLVDSALRQRDYMGKFVSPDLRNPHITRGMKGFVEWPRGNQKNGLKSKLLKALMESHKSKFRAMS